MSVVSSPIPSGIIKAPMFSPFGIGGGGYSPTVISSGILWNAAGTYIDWGDGHYIIWSGASTAADE